jgi:nicotinamide riboside kinase
MLKIAITGPESSGKTTLAHDLCAELGVEAIVVSEFARVYLGAAGATYTQHDFEHMLHGQQAWEQWYAGQNPSFLICDTDPNVFYVWSMERYGAVAASVNAYMQAYQPDLTILCTPEMAWETDPLREHPTDRWRLFEQYQALLGTSGVLWSAVTGDRRQRVEEVIRLLTNL